MKSNKPRSDANDTVIALNQMLENMDNLLHSSQGEDRRQKLLELEKKQRELQLLCESALAAEEEKAAEGDFSQRGVGNSFQHSLGLEDEDVAQYAQRCAEQLESLAQECRAATEQVQQTRKENESLRGVNQQLTTKVECLARHLVKAIKERNALEAQADQYLEMLEAAQLELKSRGTAATAIAAAPSRPAVVTPIGTSRNADLARAHSEVERLTSLLATQRDDNGKKRQALLAAHEQQLVELKCATVAAEERANDTTLAAQSAELAAEKLADELEVALHHIRSLDEALQKSEAALAAERRRALLEPKEQLGQDDAAQADWPLSARLEVARLRAQLEAAAQQTAVHNRHVDTRLATLTTSCESAQIRGAELEQALRAQNQLLQGSQREKALVEARAYRLQQQLRDVRQDAADVDAILSKTRSDVEFAVISATDDQSLSVAKQLQRDHMTMSHFLTALLSMEVDGMSDGCALGGVGGSRSSSAFSPPRSPHPRYDSTRPPLLAPAS